MKDYNHEIKVLSDFRNRYVNIQCEGGYGNDPSVIMLSRESFINEGFVKDVDVKLIGRENDKNIYDTFLIIDTEYGTEIRLPYKKIIGATVLSSGEQAMLEHYNRNKEQIEEEIIKFNKMIENGELPKEYIDTVKALITNYRKTLSKGEELIEKGVKTYK